MDTFTKRDSSSITKHMAVSKVYRYNDLLREKAILELRKKILDSEMKENEDLLNECEKLGVS